MLKLVAIATICVPLLVIGALIGSSWMVIDVDPADGPHVIVPAPLFVARAALRFAPRDVASFEVPELTHYSDLAMQVLDELAEAADGVLVEVDEPGDHVLVTKERDELRIELENGDEEVHLRLPIDVALHILEGCEGERIELPKVLASLSKASRTKLLHVKTPDEEVKIRIW